jgi:hypothetical protein
MKRDEPVFLLICQTRAYLRWHKLLRTQINAGKSFVLRNINVLPTLPASRPAASQYFPVESARMASGGKT